MNTFCHAARPIVETIQLLDNQFSATAERQGIRVSQTYHLSTNFKFDPQGSGDEVMLALNDRQ